MTRATKPFEGLTVVNAGVGLGPALIGKFLADFGAEVARVAPDGGDPFATIYPAYEILRANERPLNDVRPETAALSAATSSADICILGGEDHPGVSPRADAAALLATNDRLVVLDIAGYPDWSDGAGRPATETLVQARGGMSFEHYTDRPNFVAFMPVSYGLFFQGLLGIIGALYDRQFSGRGQLVSTSLYEGMLSWLTPWAVAERSNAAFDLYFPRNPQPIIMPTRDGKYLHVTLGSKGSKFRLYQALGVDEPGMDPNDAGMPQLENGPELFFGDLKRLGPAIAKLDSDVLLERLRKGDVAADVAQAPGACWQSEQVRQNDVIVKTAAGVRHIGRPFNVTPAGVVAPTAGPTGTEPLSGLTVLDFGGFVAGPFASVALSDLGADVIKIEPLYGDPMRPVFRGFASSNRGKRSIALDMKTPEGTEIARRLCLKADVVASNFKPGASKRLGIDAESLHAERPSLVMLDAPGYGAEGPDRDRPAFDPIIQAFCGHELRAGGEGNTPMWSATAMVDYTGGYLGSLAAMLGLYHRARSGEGSLLTVPLLSAGVFLLSDIAELPDGSWLGAGLNDHRQAGLHPCESFYETADGWIAMSIRSQRQADAVIRTLEIPALDGLAPSTWGNAEADVIAAACKERSTDALVDALETAGIWVEQCRKDMEKQTLEDAQLAAAGLVHSFDHFEYGRVKKLGPLYRLGRSTRSKVRPVPRLGEHSREVLAELGYSAQEIDGFFQRRIVG